MLYMNKTSLGPLITMTCFLTETIHKITGQGILFQDKEQKNKLEMDKQIFMHQTTYIH